MRFGLELPLKVEPSAPTDDLEEQLDSVLEHLYELDGVFDPDFVASLTTGRIMFTMAVEADDELQAFIAAWTALRTAIHACDGSTPGWESIFKLDRATSIEDTPLNA